MEDKSRLEIVEFYETICKILRENSFIHYWLQEKLSDLEIKRDS